MPKISVVIPTFNNSEFIIDAIESVINQTYSDYEIIVVDDGSTDNTREILKPYYHKVKYFFKNNGGVASARNFGIKESKGDYIAFLDSDDYWTSQKLEVVNKFITHYSDAGLFYSDTYQIDRIGKIIGLYRSSDFEPKPYYRLLLDNFIPTSSVVVKKEVFDICGLFFEDFEAAAGGEDWDMWIRIAKNYRIKHIDKPLMCYRIHQVNISKRDFIKLNKDVILILERAFNNEKAFPKKIKCKAYSNAFFHAGRKYLLASMLKEARRESRRSVKLCPLQLKSYILILISYLGRYPIRLLRILYYNYQKFIIFLILRLKKRKHYEMANI